MDTKDKDGHSPLSYTAECGREPQAVVKILLARDDVEVNTQDEDDRSPLYCAAKHGQEAVAKAACCAGRHRGEQHTLQARSGSTSASADFSSEDPGDDPEPRKNEFRHHTFHPAARAI